MAFVTVTEAARLVRRSRRTLYRDIDSGRLSKTVTAAGATTIDTSELLRVYGALHREEDARREENGTSAVEDFVGLVDTWDVSQKPLHKGNSVSATDSQLQVLEEKIKSLQYVLEVEAALRKVKDEVTNELRARLEDKERVIKMLESKVILLDYSGAEDKSVPKKRRRFLARLFGMN